MNSSLAQNDTVASADNAQIAAAMASAGQRISGLDGLRAISILIVFIGHYCPVIFPQQPILVRLFPGMFGVYVFFVISGLLICTLLLNEEKIAGKIALKRFYIRRFLRLSPALLIYVAVTCLAYWLVDPHINWWAFVSAATYTSNYYQSFSGDTELYFMPVWSLAIEEHFYLIFPTLLILALKYRPAVMLAIFIALIVTVSMWRLFLAEAYLADFVQIYHNTDTRFDSILYGVVLAITMWFWPKTRVSLLMTSWWSACVGLMLLAASVVVRDEIFRMTWRYTAQGIALVLIIGFVVFGQGRVAATLRLWLDARPMRFVGNLSYSIYLWHLTILMFAVHVSGGLLPMQGVAVGIGSLGVACLSYYGIEKPLLRLRHRFGSHAAV